MNGVHVGDLIRQSSGALEFSYRQAWLETSGARPVSLSMSLRKAPYVGEVVFNFFDNLLPNNPQIRERIQTRFQVATSHPFDLLSAIGMDCVGAIQLVPEDKFPENVRQVEAVPLTDQDISKLLLGYRTTPLGMTDADDFRISLAGAQEKTALLRQNGQWYRPLGPTPTTHILKLPIGIIEHSGMDLRQSCENEWLCSRIAAAFGLPVAHTEMALFETTRVLVVERFDRRWDNDWIWRLPQEDMCQALGMSPNLKYESDGGPGIERIMRLLLQSRNARQDRALFYKSQILFWLLAAIDGHAKNFSLFIEPAGRFRLTPLYDILSAHPLMAEGQLQARKIQMAMALVGRNRHYRWHSMLPRHFLSTARQTGFNVKMARLLFEEMMDSVETVIAEVEAELPETFPEQMAESLFEGIRKQKRRGSG
jgi:serine/threonine-protein kinase HipA